MIEFSDGLTHIADSYNVRSLRKAVFTRHPVLMGIISKETKYSILNSSAFSLIVYWLLSLYAMTVRVRFENVEAVEEHVARGGRLIFSSWHQRFFGGFYLPRAFRKRICIMISQSRDGTFIANVVQRIGWAPLRGSSTRGGKEALDGMIEGVTKYQIGGHIVDGPTGPARIVKPGLISIAQKTGAVICPTYVFYENPWIAKSWDRFMIPKPFSRVLLRFDPFIPVPPEMTPEEFERLRRCVEETMIEEYRKADKFFDA